MIRLLRDDGNELVLSAAEARRAHDAYDRAVLERDLATPPRVQRCGGRSQCQTCAAVMAGKVE